MCLIDGVLNFKTPRVGQEDTCVFMALVLTPGDIGLPAKFRAWRPGQDDAIERIIEAYETKGFRYVGLSAPVGSGKTAEYVGVALMMGWRVCVLTATKGLQDQLLRDFGGVGLVDIRGRANYECMLASGWTCEEGSHARCSAQFSGRGGESSGLHMVEPQMEPWEEPWGASGQSQCTYRRALETAKRSKLVVTNYAYWMLCHEYGDGLGGFDLLVCDEAHEAEQQVCNTMRVEFTARRVCRMLEAEFPRRGEEAGIAVWRTWAAELLQKGRREYEALKEELGRGALNTLASRELAAWSSLVSDLGKIATARGSWAAEAIRTKEGNGFALEPLRASEYARGTLFVQTRRVLLVSATFTNKSRELLGLSSEEVDFQDYPYLFPVRRSPVYFWPVANAARSKRTDDGQRDIWNAIRRIVEARVDRRGLIHTVSYELRDELVAGCPAVSGWFLTHARNSESVRQTIERFREEEPPVVLASPSIATGVDFPYADAEYQIIPKLPFPVTKGAIMAARCNKKTGDPQYSNYLLAQKLSQMIGRPMRAEDDRAETFILDTNYFWVRNLQGMFPSWVRRLVVKTNKLPAPPPALYGHMAAAMGEGVFRDVGPIAVIEEDFI